MYIRAQSEVIHKMESGEAQPEVIHEMESGVIRAQCRVIQEMESSGVIRAQSEVNRAINTLSPVGSWPSQKNACHSASARSVARSSACGPSARRLLSVLARCYWKWALHPGRGRWTNAPCGVSAMLLKTATPPGPRAVDSELTARAELGTLRPPKPRGCDRTRAQLKR